MAAFFSGLIAGYGIAVPVGAIAVLIIHTALRQGFRAGFMAGAGAASADFLYAVLAVVAGELIGAALAPYALPMKILSALALLVIGVYGLWVVRRNPNVRDDFERPESGSLLIFAKFLGLTLLNPLTITYFGALILADTVGDLETIAGKISFIIGAGIASLSWQSILALFGSLGHRYLSPGIRIVTSLVGNLIILGFGVRILWQLIS